MDSDQVTAAAGRSGALDETISAWCHVLFVHDIALSIDLVAVAARLREGVPLRVRPARRSASPAQVELNPAPLRLVLDGDPIPLEAPFATEPAIEMVIHAFGAVTIRYRIRCEGSIEDLARLSNALPGRQVLQDDARRRVADVVRSLSDVMTKPALADDMEDYLLFVVDAWSGGGDADAFVERHAGLLAGVLQSEPVPLSASFIEHSLSARLSYGRDDMVIVNWNAALIIDREPEDILLVLQHANVELLEMRVLERQLDRLLVRAQDLLSLIGRRRAIPLLHDARLLREFAEYQTDSVLLFEGVNNAIKLVGDQYLARVYRLASSRLHLDQWDESVLRKIAVAESIYQKMTDARTTRRMEVLEIIIILLIALSIVMAFIPGLAK